MAKTRDCGIVATTHEPGITKRGLGHSDGSFPLTPALSLWERENRQAVYGFNVRNRLSGNSLPVDGRGRTLGTRGRLAGLFPLTPAHSGGRETADWRQGGGVDLDPAIFEAG